MGPLCRESLSGQPAPESLVFLSDAGTDSVRHALFLVHPKDKRGRSSAAGFMRRLRSGYEESSEARDWARTSRRWNGEGEIRKDRRQGQAKLSDQIQGPEPRYPMESEPDGDSDHPHPNHGRHEVAADYVIVNGKSHCKTL
jgi:hypothetical protein